MYKRIGANNWRPGVLDLLGYLYVRVPIDTSLKLDKFLRGKRVISRMFIQWDFQPRA